MTFFDVSGNCNECNKEFDGSDLLAYCLPCDEERDDSMKIHVVKYIVDDVYREKLDKIEQEFIDWTFETEEQKETFKRGYRRGMIEALFHIADLYGEDSLAYFEKIACEKGDWK